jgi:hypothetical protein
MLVDLLPYGAPPDGILVLEHSTNITASAPGRVLWFDSPTAAPLVLSDQVAGPTHMALHPATNEIWITEIRSGRIVAIPSPSQQP